MGTNLIGKVIMGQYRVDAFIASGGMGSVYQVWDLNRSVSLAMKILHSDFADDPSLLKRFEREARALRKLAHPNIVQFYGLFQSDDLFFLLEQFIDGPTLKDVLKKKNILSLGEALSYTKSICSALGFAHANQVVHCDIKPANVMIDQGGNVYLTDFGIARNADSTTTTMGSAGTPAYMAPEQITGNAVTPATDVYALGILLFEMLTGIRPFRGTENSSENSHASQSDRIRQAHISQQPPDPSMINPQIPRAVSAVILRALEKKPENRYQNAQDFLMAILTAAGVSSSSIQTRVALPAFEQQSNGQNQQSSSTNIEHGKNKTGLLAAIGVGLLFTVIIGIFIIKLIPTIGPSGAKSNPDNTVNPISKTAIVVSLSTPINQQPVTTPEELRNPQSQTPTGQDSGPSDTPSAPVVSDTPIPLCVDCVEIPAGTFIMGATEKDYSITSNKIDKDETPEHSVYLDTYWIDKMEVSNRQFAKFVQETNYVTQAENQTIAQIYDKAQKDFTDEKIREANWRNPDGTGKGIANKDDYPVVQISWQDAVAFCRWKGGRLPTEAEWEKAARGENGSVYPWGNQYDANKLNGSDQSLGMDTALNSFNDGYAFTAPVNSFSEGASPYGLLNMSGNVAEWVNDYYDPDYYSKTEGKNPQGPSSGKSHVLKGGSWFSGPMNNRSANRIHSIDGDAVMQNYGFRCAYSPQMFRAGP